MWYCGDGDSVRLYDPEIAREIEEAFSAFWSGGIEPAIFKFESDASSPSRHIDFRSMEEVSQDVSPEGGPKGKERRRVVQRRQAQAFSEAATEWGHGQDPVAGSGFVAFPAEIQLLLEQSFAQFKAGSELKGVMFTSSNGADYLVDFAKMKQLRIATRRERPVYRHRVAPGFRSGAAGSAVAPPAVVAAPASEPRTALKASVAAAAQSPQGCFKGLCMDVDMLAEVLLLRSRYKRVL